MIYRAQPLTVAEAIIALGGLASFVTLVWHGDINTWQDIGMVSAMLGIVVGFYFFLLLARAIFTFMVGGTMTSEDTFWWEKYEDKKKAAKK